MSDEHTRARQRALRAARAVTLGLGLALAGSGCTTSHSPPEGDSGPPPDGPIADAGTDTGPAPCTGGFPDTEECCESWGGYWYEGGCAVPGPFVPPFERA
jgi:hypothetical protein